MAQLKVHNPAIINEQPKFWGEGFIERNLALPHSKLGVDKRSHRVLQRYKRLTGRAQHQLSKTSLFLMIRSNTTHLEATRTFSKRTEYSVAYL